MVTLTDKQAQLLEVLKRGLSLKDAALELGVSYSRIINLCNNLLIKTGYKTHRELLVNIKSIEYEVADSKN